AALTVNDKLMKAAQGHADNLARLDKDPGKDFSPHVVEGKTPGDRAQAAGYQGVVAENTMLGSSATAPIVMDIWMKSEGHRKNIVDKTGSETGVGLAQSKAGRWWYVQVFGRPAPR